MSCDSEVLCVDTRFIYRYFVPEFTRDEVSEQTPEGETSAVALKAARKLQLGDNRMDTMCEGITEDSTLFVSSPSSSSPSMSPCHKSPFRKSPQATSSRVEAVRKQLFPTNKDNSPSSSLERFRYKLESKVEGHSPFTVLDRSQSFVSEMDSENKKCFLLTKNTEGIALNSTQSQTNREMESGQLEDPPSSQRTVSKNGRQTSSSFSYMASSELITVHPCTQGEPDCGEMLTASQRSSSEVESNSQPSRVTMAEECALPHVNLVENTPLNNRRTSFVTSTNNSKV